MRDLLGLPPPTPYFLPHSLYFFMYTFYASFYGQQCHTLDRLVQQAGKLIKLNCQRINERMIRSDHDRDFPSLSISPPSSLYAHLAV